MLFLASVCRTGRSIRLYVRPDITGIHGVRRPSEPASPSRPLRAAGSSKSRNKPAHSYLAGKISRLQDIASGRFSPGAAAEKQIQCSRDTAEPRQHGAVMAARDEASDRRTTRPTAPDPHEHNTAWQLMCPQTRHIRLELF